VEIVDITVEIEIDGRPERLPRRSAGHVTPTPSPWQRARWCRRRRYFRAVRRVSALKRAHTQRRAAADSSAPFDDRPRNVVRRWPKRVDGDAEKQKKREETRNSTQGNNNNNNNNNNKRNQRRGATALFY